MIVTFIARFWMISDPDDPIKGRTVFHVQKLLKLFGYGMNLINRLLAMPVGFSQIPYLLYITVLSPCQCIRDGVFYKILTKLNVPNFHSISSCLLSDKKLWCISSGACVRVRFREILWITLPSPTSRQNSLISACAIFKIGGFRAGR